jgi:hypothetical protein
MGYGADVQEKFNTIMTDEPKETRSRPWTPEEHQALLCLWEDKTLTQAQRAARLGRPLGSVVGRLRRHGLVEDRTLKMKFTTKTETVVAKPVIIPKTKQAALLIELVPEPIVRRGAADAVLDLKVNDCRWPIGGHPGHDPDFHFCCKKKLEGLPYCREHAGMAYSGAAPRRL